MDPPHSRAQGARKKKEKGSSSASTPQTGEKVSLPMSPVCNVQVGADWHQTHALSQLPASSTVLEYSFTTVSRPWLINSTSSLCLDPSCKPSEWCKACLLIPSMQSADTAQLDRAGSENPPRQQSLVDLHRSNYSTGQPLLQGSGYHQTELPSPVQRFVNEATSSQPYNAVFSFAPFSSLSHAGRAASVRTENEGSTHAAHGSAASGTFDPDAYACDLKEDSY
ncbi:hypothetical protein BGZ57DRAFT_59887 [Hyaloscypha finlandica]|nr:hypothetical protein BGZ57DRAFT_59887 [Hyaloscypha finlandica]